MKFIVTGDIHFRGNNPRARLDNYMVAIKRKLLEVVELAIDHNATAIICPGDLFDSPKTMWGTVAELADVLKQAPCPVLCVHGNHDIWAGNAGSKPRTPFGFLERLNFIWDVSGATYFINNVSVSGHGFNVETDTELGMEQFMPTYGFPNDFEDVYRIHLVHSMLLERPPGFEMRHTLISDVKTTANVIISGHDHTGFGIKQRDDGVLFINPGALCRLSAHQAEMERRVQVALLTIDTDGARAELIPLSSALPGHEVLSREHIENAVERENRLGRFLELLASEGESKFLEVQEIVDDIAARDNIPGEVKAEALMRIGQAQEELAVRGG